MRILMSLIKKEWMQIIRDPSSIMIAFVLPLISILVYMYGINLDTVNVTMGIKNDDPNPEIVTLVESFDHSKYINSIIYDNEQEMEEAIVRSEKKAALSSPMIFLRGCQKGKKQKC